MPGVEFQDRLLGGPQAVAMTPAPDPQDETIRQAATMFRSALDAVDPKIWLAVTIDDFPRGACGHAAELLGRYLRDMFAIESIYVLKDFWDSEGTWRGGHAWLEHDGLIVDITGDQFGWPPVIVTRSSSVHEEAENNLRQRLTEDVQWWGIYCAPVYTEALRWIAAKASEVPRSGSIGIPGQ